MKLINSFVLQTPEEGSRTIVCEYFQEYFVEFYLIEILFEDAAISPKLEGKGGSYLTNCTVWSTFNSPKDRTECEKLLNFTCKLLKIENFGMSS